MKVRELQRRYRPIARLILRMEKITEKIDNLKNTQHSLLDDILKAGAQIPDGDDIKIQTLIDEGTLEE